jgi:hypothetical protein
MSSDLLTPSVEQRYVNKFLAKEEAKLAEILCRLNAQFGEVMFKCLWLVQ